MKRITVFSGHYGSGKTNVALSVALGLARSGQSVTVADLDIVNPYFRTKDSARELEKAGIELICSDYANTNVDIPALPQSMYAITDDRSRKVVVDLGGDDRGALALGRLAPAILEENDFDLFAVINMFRPLTKTAEETVFGIALHGARQQLQSRRGNDARNGSFVPSLCRGNGAAHGASDRYDDGGKRTLSPAERKDTEP